MDTELDPIVGHWYRHLDKGQPFRVVAFDEERGIIELQHFDGDLEEIDASSWFDMEIEPTEPPEDWTGPIDDVETDDLGYTETSMRPRDWEKPLEETGDEKEEWEDERPEDERDDADDDDSAEDRYGTEPES
ncbi:MAG TPA: DUF6763 family protein [Gammaproteobacteria bacterium]|jgi:hypothetical protein